MTTYRKKLIEVALPLEAINKEAAREKSIRHGHPSTLHLWWARRPLAACRAVLFASLVDDPSSHPEQFPTEEAQDKERQRLFRIIEELVKWENSNNETVLNAARHEILKSTVGHLPAPRPGLYFVYAIQCEDGSHYIGQTDDLRRRWEEHVDGRGSEWTSRNRPLRIAHYEEVGSREEAVKREHDLKTGFGRKWLKELIESGRARQAGPPPVLDPFCGGGSIPLEAQRLGLEAHASDLNPVAVLITKALIEIPPKFAGKPPVNPEARKKLDHSKTWRGAEGLAEDVRYYGKWMRDEAEKRIGHLYPKVKLPKEQGGREAKPIAWIWARAVKCPNPACGAQMPLVRSFWLCGNKAWAEPTHDSRSKTLRFRVNSDSRNRAEGTVSRRGAKCFACKTVTPLDYVREEARAGRMEQKLMAVVAENNHNRCYLSPTDDHEVIAKSARPTGVPETSLPDQALGFRVQLYGMLKHRDLFSPRQLVAVTTFSDLILNARKQAYADAVSAAASPSGAHVSDADSAASAYADAVSTYLACALSRLASYNNAICFWNLKGGECHPNLFSPGHLNVLGFYRG